MDRGRLVTIKRWPLSSDENFLIFGKVSGGTRDVDIPVSRSQLPLRLFDYPQLSSESQLGGVV